MSTIEGPQLKGTNSVKARQICRGFAVEISELALNELREDTDIETFR